MILAVPSETTPLHVSAIPQITVIIPAYGVAHLLPQALNSLIAQDFRDWEAIVIDDGAPDDVASAVAPFLIDARIRFMATTNGGVSMARNRAISTTSAPLVALLDGDDLFEPNYLGRMVEAMRDDPHATIITCNARIFGAVPEGSQIIPIGTAMKEIGTAADIINSSFNVYIGSTFRRDAWQRVGGFDNSMTHAEDLDFWVRLLLPDGYARYINQILGNYRIREGSASGNNLALIHGRIRMLEKVIAAFPGTLAATAASKKIGKEHELEHIEIAISMVIQGDGRNGLKKLREQRQHFRGVKWSLSFGLWQVVPQLARPMLAWRRKQHRSSVSKGEYVSEEHS